MVAPEVVQEFSWWWVALLAPLAWMLLPLRHRKGREIDPRSAAWPWSTLLGLFDSYPLRRKRVLPLAGAQRLRR